MKSNSLRVLRAISFALVAVLFATTSFAENLKGIFSGNYETPRMATFDDSRGETSFALSMMPQVDGDSQQSSDIVIYVDTSASQTGVFKTDSIATLKTMLGNLNADDRVKLFAVDLDPVAMNQNFVRADSDEIKVAIQNLEKRVSLGSTDLTRMLNAATGELSKSKQSRNVVYIGDGISRAGLLHSAKFTKVVKVLADSQISVSSFAIGPERNIELLASLANSTGGNIFVDTDDKNSINLGASGLANTVHGNVFWPKSASMPTEITEIFPKTVPPLRTDRDTILIGTLAKRGEFEIKVTGTINGETKTMVWPVAAEQSSVDFSFLPQLITFARKSGGMLPTVGSAGLVEAARAFSVNAQHLSNLSNQALLSGDPAAANRLANEALKIDPLDPSAMAMAKFTKQDDDPFGNAPGEAAGQKQDDDPFGGETAPPAEKKQDPADGETTPPAAEKKQDPFGGETAPPVDPEDVTPPAADQEQQEPPKIEDGALRLVDPSFNQDDIAEMNRRNQQGTNSLLDREDARIQVITDRMKALVQVELERGRSELRTAPSEATKRWKSMLDVLDQTVDVIPSVRQELRNQLESSLMDARKTQIDFDNRLALKQRRDAAVDEHRRTIREFEDREELMSRLLNRFDTLLEEKNYEQGQQITIEAIAVDAEMPEANAAYESARVARYHEQQWELRRRREYNLVASLYEADKANMSFPGDPPLIFPDPVVWADKKARRAKYSNVRLAGNANDEKILNALDQPVENFSYDEQAFEEVMTDLLDDYGINVVLDDSARDDSLTEDELITFNASGIRLKNALRLMLKKKNATYVVKDEVLQVISIDVANSPEWFVTNVYNVGDLVAPTRPIGGGGGMMGGGMGGGGMGGGGMGGGGMGGMGGGGMGGGGMGGGGIFCVQDSLDDMQPVSKTEAKVTKKAAKMLVPPVANSPFQSWSQYFEANFASPADVRYTVRRLTKQKRTNDVIGLIQASIKHNQSQPWMYEALVLSMQMADWPKTDIERALMSTVDLSDSEQDALIAADYMVHSGLEKRAIQLLQDLAITNTTRTEPFVLGLQAAEKINDREGLKWATIGILSQAWPKHRHIVKKAIFAAEGVRKQLEKEGLTDELAAFNKELDEALYRDCIIKVSWTGDADIDIFVEEPSGTICSRQNTRTTAGGVLMGDAMTTSSDSGETAEYYVLPKGFSGDYRLMIKKVWGNVTSGKVNVSIYSHFRSDKEASQQKQLEVDDKGTLVLFKLNEGRRLESLEDHAIRTIQDRQAVVSRSVMAQAFDANSSSRAASDYYGSRYGFDPYGLAGRNNLAQLNRLRRGAVGYQPQIQQIQEGAFGSVTATTADRLYVLVNPGITFSQIARIDTFNIVGGAGNAAGQGQGVGGIGGGGGGLGGGIGGGGGGIGGGGGGIGGGLF